MKLGNLPLEYLAGFFDGEGCITIRSVGTRRKDGSINVTPCCQLTNCFEALPLEFQRRWGGNVFYRKPYGRTRQQCQWQIAGKQAEAFLNEISHLLVVKKPQAKLAMKLGSMMVSGRRTRLTAKELAQRQELKNKISLLNKGGG
jgi:hypothetical protein